MIRSCSFTPLRFISGRLFLICALMFAGLLPLSTFASTETINKATAISLHDSPKYSDGFTHFDHVNPNAKKGGSIVLPAFGSFDTLNPYLLKGISPVNSPGFGQYGISELNETLMVGTSSFLPSPDEPQSAYCLVCEYIEYPNDISWVKFKLRKEARFHNGQSITANDVIKSFELIRSNKAHPQYRDTFKPVSRVEKVDELTVQFYLSEPDLKPMIFRLGEVPIMSHTFWTQNEFGESNNTPQPLSGPYKIGKVDMGNFIEFHRVPDHWANTLPFYKGQFNFDVVRFEFFRDRTVAFEAFKSKRVNVFYEYVAKNWATAYDFPAINNGELIKEEIIHNIPSGSQAFFINARREKFSDKKVRQALTLLFDYEWTNKNIFASAYKRSNSYFPNSELGAQGTPSSDELALLSPYKKQLPPELFSQTFKLPKTKGNGNIRTQMREALKLFKEAGWKIKGGKLVHGVTQEPFAFEVLIDQQSFARVLSPFINNLQKAGIDAEIRHIDSAQYKVRLDSLDYDMISFVLPQSLSPSHEQRLYFHSSMVETKGTRNYSGVKNPVVDALINKIINATTRNELVSATKAMDRVLLWNYYTIPHWHLNYHRIAYDKKLKRPTNAPKLDLGFHSWWIE